MSGPVEIVLILAAIFYVIARRMIGEPAQGKRMLALPVILLVVGLSNLSGPTLSAMSVAFLVVTCGISVVLGAMRGASVRLTERHGLAFVQYTKVTVALWVANLAIKFGANVLFGAIDPGDATTASNSLFLTFGISLLVEGIVVLTRTLRSNSRVIWSKGKDGAPHKMSPFLDDLRGNVAGRGTVSSSSSRGNALRGASSSRNRRR
ncbi:DUF1453 domain-containing protein [Pengzhenrongella sp.]|jgi:hypothetical protein|uniref:DUF1453 domain-containing protein n=1 Tax=Pengzhenrongella sp. TaxID=2888820 RepID=UPI002F9201C6